MTYKYMYQTPKNFSNMIMNSDGEYLTGLWFEDSKDSSKHILDCEEKDLEIFIQTSKWLSLYFSGKNPKEVTDIMNTIEYGKVLTYNDISKAIAKKRGLKRMSAQAVGGAVGWNPICIIIPCHRVVGTNGSLTGYGGGIKNKVELLKLEGNDMSKYFVPKRETVI